jgi:formylglycine-generating enzyme required for sulfatase activity
MKTRFIAALIATAMGISVHAQTNKTVPNVPAKPAATVFGGVLAVKKVTIADLMKGNEFTNTAEIVLIKISPDYWVGRFEVTQAEYQKVMSGNPSQFRGNKNPVDSVSYNDALAFCGKLNEMESKEEMLPEGFSYSIPTQAQWESLAAGASLEQAVTSASGNRTGTARVGSLAPTGPGVYDIRGNVMEWCLDPADKPYRVLRGGAWQNWIEANLRPEFRHYSDGPDERQNTYGFRVVLQKP